MAVCRLQAQALASGATISEALRASQHLMYTRDGAHLDCYRPIQDFMVRHLIVCPGSMMKSPLRWYGISRT